MPKNTSNKLKIGFVVDDGMDKPDGVQQYILTLGKYFEGLGHDVRYLAGETTRTDIKNVIPLSKNLKVRFNGNSLSTPLPASKKKIKSLLKKERFDILHVQMPYSPLLAGYVIKLAPKNTKIVGTFHILPVGSLQYAGTKFLGYMLKSGLKRFDEFLSVSPPARDFAKKTFAIDSEVLPNPVDIAKFKSSQKKPDKLNIVYLGRLVPRKGCMQLLKALDILLKDKNIDADIHICGTGSEKQKLQDFIENSSLKDKVLMHGFVSETEKIKFLNSAHIAVFPSLSGESFGIVLLEAMAAGSGVVLAGNNPGYSSVMQPVKECLFDPRSPQALADKLRELINDKVKFNEMHKNQQALVKDFDIRRVGTRLLQIYRKLALNI